MEVKEEISEKLTEEVKDLSKPSLDQPKLASEVLSDHGLDQAAEGMSKKVDDSSKPLLDLEVLQKQLISRAMEKISNKTCSDSSDLKPSLDPSQLDDFMQCQRLSQAMKEISNNVTVSLISPLNQPKSVSENSHDQHNSEAMATKVNGDWDFSSINVKGSGDKRFRISFTKEQVEKLNEEFSCDNYPSEEKRNKLAADLGIDECNVKYWFKNRRRKEKLQKSPSPPQNSLFQPTEEQLQKFYNQFIRKNEERSDENSLSSVQSLDQSESNLEPSEYQEPNQVTNPDWLTTRHMDKTRKPARIPYSKNIIEKFEKIYSRCKYPQREERRQLAIEVGFDEKRVKVWFQNRRQKEKLHNSRKSDQSQDSPTPVSYRRLEERSESAPFDLSSSESQTTPLDCRLPEKKLKSTPIIIKGSSLSQLQSIDYRLLDKKLKSSPSVSSLSQHELSPFDYRQNEKKLNSFSKISGFLSSKPPPASLTNETAQKENFLLKKAPFVENQPENVAMSALYQQYYNWFSQQQSALLFMMNKQREEALSEYQQQIPESLKQQSTKFSWHRPEPSFENSESQEVSKAPKSQEDRDQPIEAETSHQSEPSFENSESQEVSKASNSQEDQDQPIKSETYQQSDDEYECGLTVAQLIPEIILTTEDD